MFQKLQTQEQVIVNQKFFIEELSNKLKAVKA